LFSNFSQNLYSPSNDIANGRNKEAKNDNCTVGPLLMHLPSNMPENTGQQKHEVANESNPMHK
jgi:hypothetical protein